MWLLNIGSRKKEQTLIVFFHLEHGAAFRKSKEVDEINVVRVAVATFFISLGMGCEKCGNVDYPSVVALSPEWSFIPRESISMCMSLFVLLHERNRKTKLGEAFLGNYLRGAPLFRHESGRY